MSKEQFDRECRYQAIIALARVMHRRGIITADELIKVDTKLREKYRPLIGGLYPLESVNSLDFTGV